MAHTNEDKNKTLTTRFPLIDYTLMQLVMVYAWYTNPVLINVLCSIFNEPN